MDNANVTDNILEAVKIQVDKGSDSFIENERSDVELKEELSELSARMKTVT